MKGHLIGAVITFVVVILAMYAYNKILVKA